MMNCKYFLLTKAERIMSGDACYFNNIETRAVITFFLMQGKTQKDIYTILTETLGGYAPSYVTVSTWVAEFKRGDFSTCDAPRPGRPKTVSTPEILDQFHRLILEDCRISTQSIAELLGTSRERVRSVIHEDLGMRKLSSKWDPACLKADQKLQRCHSSEQILEFLGAIQMISCRD